MSLRQAIDAKCRDCIHDPLAGGTALQQVIDCPCTDCPLWPVRPQRAPSAERRLIAEQRTDSLRSSSKHAAGGTTPAVRQEKAAEAE